MSEPGEPAGEAWEDDDCVRRTVVLPAGLAESLAARAAHRGLSFSDLLSEYAADGLRRDGMSDLPGVLGRARPPPVGWEQTQGRGAMPNDLSGLSDVISQHLAELSKPGACSRSGPATR